MLVYDIKPARKAAAIQKPPTIFDLFRTKTRIFFSSLSFRAGRALLVTGVSLTLALNSAHFAAAPGATLVPFAPQQAQATEDLTRAELEQKLREIELEISQYEGSIRDTQAQTKTLKQQISVLETQAKKINLQIQATDLQIRRLSTQIRDTNEIIRESELKISQAKTLLEKSLRAMYENDQQSLLEILLAHNALSDFFAEIGAQVAIQSETQKGLDEITALKEVLEAQRAELLNQREDQESLFIIQGAQRRQLSEEKKSKDQLFTLTKGKESLYQQLLKQSQKTAAEIRVQLYKLLGGGEIKFEDALRYAEFAGTHTGIRPALLLAVLDKESDLGRNVGRCSWKTAMHPTRDQPVFLEITRELGINPDTISVSCPIVRDGSYGGAMGIAQFLPSTWILYKDRIKAIVGRTPSPWNPQDAFIASALYLADAGATAKTYAAERQAAAKYYAGRRWRYYLYSYGSHVMELASGYQSQIEILKRTASR